jgi:hypothetical protein
MGGNPFINFQSVKLGQPAHFDKGNAPLADHPIDCVDGEIQVAADLFDAEEPRLYCEGFRGVQLASLLASIGHIPIRGAYRLTNGDSLSMHDHGYRLVLVQVYFLPWPSMGPIQ